MGYNLKHGGIIRAVLGMTAQTILAHREIAVFLFKNILIRGMA
jgi:hypothetical protein